MVKASQAIVSLKKDLFSKVICVVGLSLFCSCGNNSVEGGLKNKYDAITEIYSTDEADVEMNAAIESAKRTFPDFMKAWEKKDTQYYSFSVKQKFPTADGGGEHIWINVFDVKNGEIYGVVGNDVVNPVGVQNGDTIKIDKEKMTDWMYTNGDTLQGGYTVRLLYKRLSPSERKKFDSDYGFIIK